MIYMEEYQTLIVKFISRNETAEEKIQGQGNIHTWSLD